MAEPKHIRRIELKDEELKALVQEKMDTVSKGRAIAQEMEDFAKLHDKKKKEHEALFADLNRIKLKIIKRVKKVASKELGEFELPVTTELVDGKLMFEITDGLIEFKESYKNFDKWSAARPK